MPPARSATSTARRSAARTKAAPRRAAPRSVPLRLSLSKIKWDRTFRTVMLLVLGFVGWLGVQGATTLLATRAQADQEQAIVHRLAVENRRLADQQTALTQRATIIRDARALGMVSANERAYAVTGLPGR